MARNTSSPTSTYWMILPTDPLLEGSPSEMLLPSRVARVKVIVTPTVTAITTPARKAAESFRGLEAVMKISADMICGPAFMVIARGMMARFMAAAPLALSVLQQLPVAEAYVRFAA